MDILKLQTLENEYKNKLTEYESANATYISKLKNPSEAIYTEISGKTYWGTTQLSEGVSNNAQECQAMCSADPACKGATFNLDKKYCWARGGDSSITDGLSSDSAIILTSSQDLLNLNSLNQQLLDLNTQIITLYNINVPIEENNINTITANGQTLSENYLKLLDEKKNIKKLLDSYNTADQEYNDQTLVVEQNNFAFYLWFALAIVAVIIVIKLIAFPEIKTDYKSAIGWTILLICTIMATLQLKNSMIYSIWVLLIVAIIIVKFNLVSYLT